MNENQNHEVVEALKSGACNPEFKWKHGADVQAVWRRYGWVPPSETKFKQELFLPENNTK